MTWDTYNTKGIKEKYVYRYVTIEKLVDFLESSSIFLTRLDKFEDNLENIEPYDINELKVRTNSLKKPEDANPDISDDRWGEIIQDNIAALKGLQKSLDLKQKHRYVSCWILNEVESFAMWDIYGKAGFAIRFERKYFQKLIKESIKVQEKPTSNLDIVVAGAVKYQNYDDMLFKEKESLLKFSAFRKHLSFKHEAEYRIVGFMKEILNIPGLKFKLPEIENLKFDIISNPRLNSFQFKQYESMISKYSKNHPLKESDLKRWLDFKNINY